MFKELGEFIDDVGRITKYALYKLVSEEEEHRTAGICFPEIPEDLPEDLKRELEKEEVVVRDHTKNNK